MKGMATKPIMIMSLTLTLGTLLSGCFSANSLISYGKTGPPPQSQTLHTLKKGQTKKQELTSLLGQPASCVEKSDGSEILKYDYVLTTENKLSMPFLNAQEYTTTNHSYYFLFENDCLKKYWKEKMVVKSKSDLSS